MLEKDGILLNDVEEANFDQPWHKDNVSVKPQIYGHIGSGSGGYSDQIFKYAAEELFGIKVENIEYKNLRFVVLPYIF